MIYYDEEHMEDFYESAYRWSNHEVNDQFEFTDLWNFITGFDDGCLPIHIAKELFDEFASPWAYFDLEDNMIKEIPLYE